MGVQERPSGGRAVCQRISLSDSEMRCIDAAEKGARSGALTRTLGAARPPSEPGPLSAGLESAEAGRLGWRRFLPGLSAAPAPPLGCVSMQRCLSFCSSPHRYDFFKLNIQNKLFLIHLLLICFGNFWSKFHLGGGRPSQLPTLTLQ